MYSRFATPRLVKYLKAHKGALQIEDVQLAVPVSKAFDQCFASLSAIKGMRIAVADRENGILRAVTGLSWQSPGEVVGVEISALGPDASAVCVYSKPLSLFGLDFGRCKSNVTLLSRLIGTAGAKPLPSAVCDRANRMNAILNSLTESERHEFRVKLIVMNLCYLKDRCNISALLLHYLVSLVVFSGLSALIASIGGLKLALIAEQTVNLSGLSMLVGMIIGLAVLIKGKGKHTLRAVVQVEELQLQVPASKAFEACFSVLSANGNRVEAVNREDKTLSVITPLSWKSAGEQVGIEVQELHDGRCGVRVFSRPLYPGAPDFGVHRNNLVMVSNAIKDACTAA